MEGGQSDIQIPLAALGLEAGHDYGPPLNQFQMQSQPPPERALACYVSKWGGKAALCVHLLGHEGSQKAVDCTERASHTQDRWQETLLVIDCA